MRKYISFKIIIIVLSVLLSSGSIAYALGYLKYENNNTFLIHPGLSVLDVTTIQSSLGSNFSIQVLRNIHIESDFKIESDGVVTFEFKDSDNQIVLNNRGGGNPRFQFIPVGATQPKWWMGLRDSNSKGNFFIFDNGTGKTVFEIGGKTAFFPSSPIIIKGVLDIKNASGFANVTVKRPDNTTMNRGYGLQIASNVVLPSEIQLGEYVDSESEYHLFSMKKNGNIVEFNENNPAVRVLGATLDYFFVDGELELDTDICTDANICLVNQFARKLDCKVKTASSNTTAYSLEHPSCDSGYERVSVGCYIDSQGNNQRYLRSTEKNASCEFWKESSTTSLRLEAYSVCCKL